MKKRIQELHKRLSIIKDSKEDYMPTHEHKMSMEEKFLLQKILANDICLESGVEDGNETSSLKKIKLTTPSSKSEEYFRELFKKFLYKLSKNHILVEEKLFTEMKCLLTSADIEPNLLSTLYEESASKAFENWENTYYSQCNDRRVLRFVEKYREQINDIVSNNESKWLKEDVEYQETSPKKNGGDFMISETISKAVGNEAFFMTPPRDSFHTAEKILSPIDINTIHKSVKKALFLSTPLNSFKKEMKENMRFESPSNLLNFTSPEKRFQPSKLSRFILQ